jgi:hypothetical protein
MTVINPDIMVPPVIRNIQQELNQESRMVRMNRINHMKRVIMVFLFTWSVFIGVTIALFIQHLMYLQNILMEILNVALIGYGSVTLIKWMMMYICLETERLELSRVGYDNN